MNEIYRTGMIDVKEIQCSDELRMHFQKDDVGNVEDANTILSESLSTHGMIDPIKVRMMKKDSYLLLDGLKRLTIHKKLHPNKPICCSIKMSQCVRDGGIEDTITDQDFSDAATYNLAREKVPHRIVEEIVSKFQKKEWGYERIARAIGYSKSGVQKIVNRLKKKENKSESAEVTAHISVKELRRTRTMLNKVRDLFNKELPEDVDLALMTIDDFLNCQEQKLLPSKEINTQGASEDEGPEVKD